MSKCERITITDPEKNRPIGPQLPCDSSRFAAMKRVLLITYYWPPSGGAGVQRVLKLVKYLRDFGWEPVVFTAKDAAYPIVDETLLQDVPDSQEVWKGDIWEPYEVYKKFTGQGGKEKVYSGFMNEDKGLSLTQKLSIWIRGNFFIPDARAFWIKPATNFLVEKLRTEKIDAIISSGPPHTAHMIARNVHRATDIPWIADFRDPWTNIDFYDQLMLSKWADRRHRKMEASIVAECNRLTTVTWTWKEEFQALGAKQVEVITNGFDDADFPAAAPEPEEGFVFNYIGFLNEDRNNSLLWEAFGELCSDIPAMREVLRFRFVGKADHVVFRDLEKNGLLDLAERIDYVPHSEALAFLTKARYLILLINDVRNAMGHIPGKTYEYLGSRRPILCIGPEESDAARVIRECEAGEVCGFTDKEAMKRVILSWYQAYQAGDTMTRTGDISAFTRRAATQKMALALDQVAL